MVISGVEMGSKKIGLGQRNITIQTGFATSNLLPWNVKLRHSGNGNYFCVKIEKKIHFSLRKKKALHFRETSIQCRNYSVFINICISNSTWYFPMSPYFPRLAFKITNLPKLRNYYLPEIRRRHWVKNEESIKLQFEMLRVWVIPWSKLQSWLQVWLST